MIFDGEELVYGRQLDDPGRVFPGAPRSLPGPTSRMSRRGAERAGTWPVSSSTWSAASKLTINQEPNSLNLAPNLVHEVWNVARSTQGQRVQDPGRPGSPRRSPCAQQRGAFPAIDLIDFDYPYWHKADDLPKNCSAESLAEVGRVVTAWLTQPPPRRRTRR